MIGDEIEVSAIDVVVADAHSNPEGSSQPEEARQLHSFRVKTAGKQNVDQILEIEGKMVSQRVAVTGSVTEVQKSIKDLRADIASGHKPNGSLIKGH